MFSPFKNIQKSGLIWTGHFQATFRPLLIHMDFEKLSCWAIWIGSVFYALYSFTSTNLTRYFDLYDLSPGWLIDSRKDVSDYEWTIMSSLFLSNYGLIIAYILLSQLIWNFCPKLTELFIIIYGLISVSIILTPLTTTLIMFNIIFVFLIHLTSKKSLIYINFVIILFMIHRGPLWQIKSYLFGSNEQKKFLFEVSMAWLNAKCLSFSIDRMDRKQHHHPNTLNEIIRISAYCLYFPLFFTGPIYQYSLFCKDLNSRPSWESSRIMPFLFQLLRFAFWTLFHEFLLHLIYSSSTQYYPEIVENLNSWALCGLGYALPCLFYLKYFIIYGSVGVVAKIDGIHAPPAPKCISRIHLCSQLWRHFDRGLHLWLSMYFYKPLINSCWSLHRKLLAGATCFMCVCLWHGMDRAVLTWCFLNFIGVSIEKFGISIGESVHWTKLKSNLSVKGEQRLKALIGGPFFALMIISNIFFLSNYEVGLIFVKKIIFTYPLPLLPTLIVMYAGCNVSIDSNYIDDLNSNKRPKYSVF